MFALDDGTLQALRRGLQGTKAPGMPSCLRLGTPSAFLEVSWISSSS